MTRIDFYISTSTHADTRYLIACKLAEKAYKLGHQIYINTESSAQDQHIDDLLWTFREGSFIPHRRQTENAQQPVPIVIGHATTLSSEANILINLAQQIPDFFSQFERVAELVSEDSTTKLEARKRYQFYRDRGYELNTHQVSST